VNTMAKQRKKVEPGGETTQVVSTDDSMSSVPSQRTASSKGIVGNLRSWLTLNTLASLFCVAYLYTTIKSMRSLIYPFEGVSVTPGAPAVKPLWPEGTPLRLVAYLSVSPKATPVKALNGTASPNLPVLWEAGGAVDVSKWGHTGDKARNQLTNALELSLDGLCL
jgi:hypothetical protein